MISAFSLFRQEWAGTVWRLSIDFIRAHRFLIQKFSAISDTSLTVRAVLRLDAASVRVEHQSVHAVAARLALLHGVRPRLGTGEVLARVAQTRDARPPVLVQLARIWRGREDISTIWNSRKSESLILYH